MAMPRTALFTLPLFTALALAWLAGPRPAAAQAPGWHPAPLLVAQKHRRTSRRRHDGRIIACRPQGCFRIPYGCHTETEFDFWGNPTGYDAIVCPRR
jgi:hypothetical protein